MIVLALDTSTARGSLALVEEGRDPVEAYLTPGTTHSKTLLPEIDRLLSGRGLAPAGLDLIAVGLGPGELYRDPHWTGRGQGAGLGGGQTAYRSPHPGRSGPGIQR